MFVSLVSGSILVLAQTAAPPTGAPKPASAAEKAAEGPGAPKPAVPAPPGPAEAPVAPTPPARSSSAKETQYVVEAGAVIAVDGDDRTKLSLSETALAVEKDENLLYVAAGQAGVFVYDVSSPLEPKLARRARPPHGSAVGFHHADGQLWVVLLSRSAIPIGEMQVEGAAEAAEPNQHPTAPVTRPPVAAARNQRISVLRATPGQVELAIGAGDGIRVGDRFNIFRTARVNAEGGEGFTGEELLTTAEVIAVKDDSALAEIGRSAIVTPSDYAMRAGKDKDEESVFPPYMPNVGEGSVVIRPLINAGTPLGFGVLADLEGSYWGKGWFAGLRIQPLGLGLTDEGTVVSTSGLVEGGYDSHALAVGLGVGLSFVNGDIDYMLRASKSGFDTASTAGSPSTQEIQETHTAPTLSQLARLGSRDGLNLWIHNILILQDNSAGKSGFIYGGTTARASIPTGRRSDVLVEGGGGVMGYWFAGVGIASWIFGNGSPGSWRVSVSVGAAGIQGSKLVVQTIPQPSGLSEQTSSFHERIEIAGPMVSFGLAHRFAF